LVLTNHGIAFFAFVENDDLTDENSIILLSQLLAPKSKEKVFHKLDVHVSTLLIWT